MLIRKEMYTHEEKIAKEIKENKSNGKDIWKYIKVLKGEKESEKKCLLDNIYGEDGRKLERDEVTEEITNFWSGVYGKHANNIKEILNGERKQEYEREKYNRTRDRKRAAM